jgi:FAD:protein FMN transferase
MADPIVHVEEVMGTVVSMHVFRGRCPEGSVREAIGSSCARLHELEAIFTTFNDASPMSRLRAGALSLNEAPPEIGRVLELCERAKWMTNGWFDPWSMPGGVDPSGLVKGWAVEQAAGLLAQAGVAGAVVNGGGDVSLLGSSPDGGPWRVGIQHPWRKDSLACVVAVESGAIATSGGYARPPQLVGPGGRGLGAVASASVLGDSLAFADACATAVAVGGAEAAEAVGGAGGYEVYWIDSDGTENSTPGFVCC